MTRFIQCASHGFDHVDVAAANSRRIVVCNIGATGQNGAEQTEKSSCFEDEEFLALPPTPNCNCAW